MKFKAIIGLIIAFTACLVCFVPVYAADIKHASVSGTGRILADAETASISFSAEGNGKDLKSAEKAVNEIVYKIEKVLGKDGKISLEGYYSFCGENGTVYATKNLVIKTDDPKSVSKITEKLISNGASSVCQPIYDLKKRSEWESKALKSAYANAIERAKVLGITTEPNSLRDLGSIPYCCYDFIPNSDGKICVECKIILGFGGK